MNDITKAYYFGCKHRAGHYMWSYRLPSSIRFSEIEDMTPWGYDIDGRLTPKSTSAQGAALLHHRDGWTALGLHDYTVDTRPGSNSVFFFNADLNFEDTVEAAGRYFPHIVQRIGDIYNA